MLEGNIDAKDLEYIKAYSEFLVNHSPQSVVGEMKELALKGDLNATRFWYKYSKIGDCKELDDKMENMQPWSVDEGYALAFYNYQKEKDTLRNLLVERSNAVREYNAYADLFLLGGNVTTDKVAFLRMKKESINHQIDNLKFVKNLEGALTRAEKIFTTERNCYMLQKAFEICEDRKTLLPHKKYLELDYNPLFKMYLAYYKKNYKKMSDEEKKQFAFYFSKATLESDCKKSYKYKPLAKALLSELAGISNNSEDTKQ